MISNFVQRKPANSAPYRSAYCTTVVTQSELSSLKSRITLSSYFIEFAIGSWIISGVDGKKSTNYFHRKFPPSIYDKSRVFQYGTLKSEKRFSPLSIRTFGYKTHEMKQNNIFRVSLKILKTVKDIRFYDFQYFHIFF